jgi:protease IV
MKTMSNFFKYVFASMLGFIFGYIIIFLIVSSILIGTVSYFVSKSMKSDKELVVQDKSILKIDFSTVAERIDDSPFAEFTSSFDESMTPLSLKGIIDEISKAKKDRKISGIYLNFGMLSVGLSSLSEVRTALLNFKKSGKFIYAFSDFYTEKSYYLASVADSVFMQPEGNLIFNGFHMEMAFFRGTFDKLGIEPKIIRHGKFKSAGESLDKYAMSNENRIQLTEMVNSMYNKYLIDISKSRKISKDELYSIANDFKVKTAQDAVKNKLVDKLFYTDEMIALMKKKTGRDKLNFITLSRYKNSKVQKEDKAKEKTYTKNRIALIYAVGNIVIGEGSNDMIGSESLSAAIRKARLDKDVKAIVLRINSGGGSALASDIILREVLLAKKEKPFVVSMGDVAASGGYYIACAADSILAEPTTLTGSIGVIGMIVNMEKFWKDKVGVSFDRIKTGTYADLGNPNRAMTKDEEQIIQMLIDGTYKTFIKHVAEGRKMKVDNVDSLGQGRVWTGEQALKNKLVDKMGGLTDAIEVAARMAKMDNYRIMVLPKMDNPIEKFFKTFNLTSIKVDLVKSFMGDDYLLYNQIKDVKEFNGIYTIMPYYFTID